MVNARWVVPTNDELEGFVALKAARLMKVSDDVMAGNHGLDRAMMHLLPSRPG